MDIITESMAVIESKGIPMGMVMYVLPFVGLSGKIEVVVIIDDVGLN